jgi:hypothetical protein
MLALTSGLAGFDIRTFECPACNDVHPMVVELADPMKSLETGRCFLGELRAPN